MMYYHASRRAFGMFAFLALLLGANACTDAHLQMIPTKPANGVDNKLTAAGEACTASPGVVGYPYKVLFIVDVSGSTAQSDPTSQRGPAVQRVIDMYNANPEISFGIINFDSTPRQLTPTFTKDAAILTPIIPQLNQNLQTTNYLDTLTMARNMIAQDANNLSESERSRTRYDIQWLSDGTPVPCSNVQQVVQAENDVTGLTQSLGLFDVRLSTIFLTGANGDAGGCTDPRTLMMAMATAGRGSYQELTGANLNFKIDFSEIKQPFNAQKFYVVNHSRVVKNNQLLPDSDTDGVSDADEMRLGTDPTKFDTANMGCDDRANELTSVNPNLCNSICTARITNGDPNSLPDTDGDGLRDCEESALSSKSAKADSDGDNLIDPLEERFGTALNDPSTLTVDTDLDGTVDATEVFTGTDPLTAESDRSLAYVYAALTPAQATTAGTNCFNFNVSNIQLVQTEATPTSKAGDNLICLYVEQLPTGDSSSTSEVTLSKACFIANYSENDGNAVKIPADGFKQFSPSDFTPVICASAACK